jgi:predicted nucleotidyltransferase
VVHVDGLERLRQTVSDVLADHAVVFSYVFGSRGRGDARPDSDVDVAVRFDDELTADERFAATLRLGVQLEAALGGPVDVVDLKNAPLRLVGRILAERVVMTGHDAPERIRFETRQFKLAVDFEHHAAELDRQLLRAMAEARR